MATDLKEFEFTGDTQYFGPRLFQPLLAGFRIQMIRHKSRFLIRKSQIMQQFAHVVPVVQNAKLTLDLVEPAATSNRS
jgi:hypothetical protein